MLALISFYRRHFSIAAFFPPASLSMDWLLLLLQNNYLSPSRISLISVFLSIHFNLEKNGVKKKQFQSQFLTLKVFTI